MLRLILLAAVTISAVAGSVPAFAFTGSCSDWCSTVKCPHGQNSGSPVCMSKCMVACQAKHPNAK
jgi:hypothetical protein